jgi:hypothetical protein
MKKIKYLFMFLFILTITSACAKEEPVVSEEVSTTTVEVSWVNNYVDFEGLIDASDLIIVGKLIEHVPEKRHDLIFTKEQIEIKKVVKGDNVLEDAIEILFTGGVLGDEESPTITDAPLLEEDKQYIFFLQYADEGHYLISGGYQGYAEYSGDTFNLSGKHIEGMNGEEIKIEDIENYLQQ